MSTTVRSFEQCLKVLYKHPVSIVCPNSLDISFYESIASKFRKHIAIERFDERYFSGIQGYNKLMLSLEFYKRFKDFKYILLYQLDAWVFRDELNYWCQKGYDYVGAPWFEEWHEASLNSPIIGVGNGGFSLRRTQSLIKLIRIMNHYELVSDLIKMLKIKPLIRKFGIMEDFVSRIEKIKLNGTNEDYHLFILSAQFKWFNIAPFTEALRFSFDVNPETLYKMNNNQLPFGCHAW